MKYLTKMETAKLGEIKEYEIYDDKQNCETMHCSGQVDRQMDAITMSACTLRVLIMSSPNWRGKISGQYIHCLYLLIINTPTLASEKGVFGPCTLHINKQLAFRYLSIYQNYVKKFEVDALSIKQLKLVAKIFPGSEMRSCNLFSLFQVCPQSMQGTIGESELFTTCSLHLAQ